MCIPWCCCWWEIKKKKITLTLLLFLLLPFPKLSAARSEAVAQAARPAALRPGKFPLQQAAQDKGQRGLVRPGIHYNGGGRTAVGPRRVAGRVQTVVARRSAWRPPRGATRHCKSDYFLVLKFYQGIVLSMSLLSLCFSCQGDWKLYDGIYLPWRGLHLWLKCI